MTSPLIVLERAVLLHELLDRAGIAHAIGGALALAYHVEEARATRDIDLNVSVDPDDPEVLFRLLPPEIPWDTGDVAAVKRTGQVRLWWPVDGPEPPIPLDLFFPQGPLHEAIDGHVEKVPMLDSVVPILNATHLMVFKMLFDRRKDWADIEELVRFKKADLAAARDWIRQLLGDDDERLVKLADVVADVEGLG